MKIYATSWWQICAGLITQEATKALFRETAKQGGKKKEGGNS